MASTISAQPSVDLLSLITSTGSSRQNELMFLTQLVSIVWGAVSTGKVLPLVSPLVIGFVIAPLTKFVKSLSKTLVFFGIVAWLVSSLVPIIFAGLGIAGASAFVGRSLGQSPFFSNVSHLVNDTEAGLRYLKMDSQQCRMMLACRAGEFMNLHYPGVVAIARGTGIAGTAHEYAVKGHDAYVVEALEVVMGEKNGTCVEVLEHCPSLETIETILTGSGARHPNDFSVDAGEDSATEPTVMESNIIPELLTNDVVVKAIRTLASGNGLSAILSN